MSEEVLLVCHHCKRRFMARQAVPYCPQCFVDRGIGERIVSQRIPEQAVKESETVSRLLNDIKAEIEKKSAQEEPGQAQKPGQKPEEGEAPVRLRKGLTKANREKLSMQGRLQTFFGFCLFVGFVQVAGSVLYGLERLAVMYLIWAGHLIEHGLTFKGLCEIESGPVALYIAFSLAVKAASGGAQNPKK